MLQRIFWVPLTAPDAPSRRPALFDISCAATGRLRVVSESECHAVPMVEALIRARSDFRGLCRITPSAADPTARLADLRSLLRQDDALLLTAGDAKDTPFALFGKQIRPGAVQTRPGVLELTDALLAGVPHPLADAILCDYTALIEAALAARANAYCRYSHYAVGAALLTADGKIHPGANIENASYPVCCCAERTALFGAVSAGEREFRAIAIAGGAEHQPPADYCAPCGVCRQALAEFCTGDFRIILVKSPTDYHIHLLDELLPLAFTLNGG